MQPRARCRLRGRSYGGIRDPHEHGSVLVYRKLFGLDNFGLQVFEILLVQIEASPERSV
jgi:hypothetical protein